MWRYIKERVPWLLLPPTFLRPQKLGEVTLSTPCLLFPGLLGIHHLQLRMEMPFPYRALSGPDRMFQTSLSYVPTVPWILLSGRHHTFIYAIVPLIRLPNEKVSGWSQDSDFLILLWSQSPATPLASDWQAGNACRGSGRQYSAEHNSPKPKCGSLEMEKWKGKFYLNWKSVLITTPAFHFLPSWI